MNEPFSIDTSALRKRTKPSDQKTLRSVDQRGEESGFRRARAPEGRPQAKPAHGAGPREGSARGP